MSQQIHATVPYRNKIALVFDFDGTLAPRTHTEVIKRLGFEPAEYEEEYLKPLQEDGWETVLAMGHIYSKLAKEKELTRDFLEKVGREMPLYDGVEQMFETVREAARETNPEIEVEFYLLTAGFTEVPKATRIAKEFKEIYGGALHFDDQGRPEAVKRILTHPEKPLYLLQLAKGFDFAQANPRQATEPLDPDEWYIPLDQMIYVGDGHSDMPAFDLVQRYGGIGLGVFEAERAEDWEGRDKIETIRRVENLAPNDYTDGSELLESLLRATHSLCHRVALRKLGKGE